MKSVLRMQLKSTHLTEEIFPFSIPFTRSPYLKQTKQKQNKKEEEQEEQE